MFNKKHIKKLYIDFDGVIVDTIKYIDKMLKEKGLYGSSDIEKVIKAISELDYFKLIRESEIIKGSLEGINKLIENNFDVTILSHVCSMEELRAKLDFLEKNIKNYKALNVVGVPKGVSKILMMDPVGNILVDDYSGNLRIWEQHGGIGIKFTNEKTDEFKTIDNLLDLLDISM